MLDQSKAQAQALAGTDWENAANRNVAYFTVAAALLDPTVATDSSIPQAAAEELALIEAASSISVSPVMAMGASNSTHNEDYTQYIPAVTTPTART